MMRTVNLRHVVVVVAVAIVSGLALLVANGDAMTTVRVIQARVQGDLPQWHDEKGTFVSAYGKTFAEKYRAVFDTVNTASVEGALMYVQAEGINAKHNTQCQRKNSMQYIVFYELHIVQPDVALEAYEPDATTLPEYAPFVAMDGGACTPTTAGATLPAECNAFFGGDGKQRLGASVGASKRDTDPRAPYPNAVWFSFPNSCVMKKWGDKDNACRQQFPGGLCGYGSQPDGQICTFTYKTLGYINLDDLVGITFLTNPATQKRYTNYTEFCFDKSGEYKGVEFSVDDGVDDDAKVTSLPFWKKPFDFESNRRRAQQMVELYNKLAASGANHMTALPSPEQLAKENPPCFANSQRCAAALFGCKRELYAQVCRVCESADDGCVKKVDQSASSSAGVDGDAHNSSADADERDLPGHVVASDAADAVVVDAGGSSV